MLKVKLNHLLIAASLFVAALSPLQLLADTVLPQYSDDVHLGVTSCAGSTCPVSYTHLRAHETDS